MNFLMICLCRYGVVYTGRNGSENFAGCAGRPPLVIPAGTCALPSIRETAACLITLTLFLFHIMYRYFFFRCPSAR